MHPTPQAFRLAQINDWMTLALGFAKTATCLNEVPIGAIVVKDNALVSGGYNRKDITNDPTAHAEIVAIRNAAKRLGTWRLDDCVLVSTMEPCPMCAGAILQSRIKTVIYGAKDLRWGAAGTISNVLKPEQYNHTVEVIHVPHRECIEIIKRFFLKRRQKNVSHTNAPDWRGGLAHHQID